MEPPTRPPGEAPRLAALRGLGVLDTPPEERFDRVTRLARRLFSVPIALVSLVDSDRQWFKSKQGLDATETGRDISFCGHTILGDAVFVVGDAHLDPRFSDNPLVLSDPNIRFYAGCPIEAAGERVGTLCLIDRVPRALSEDDHSALRDLATMVERELEAVRTATTDELTGLSNRRGFLALAEQATAVARRHGVPQTLLYVDLDRFKEINDRWGHQTGDQALREMSAIMLDTFRESDVVARLGGDEFVVLLTGVDETQTSRVLDRLKSAVETANQRASRPYVLRYSVGATAIDAEQHPSVAEAMSQADDRMYHHKRNRTAASAAGVEPGASPPHAVAHR
jgi:diguanylate cyclase (GGDEF)-like protein